MLFINPRIKDVEELKNFSAKLQAWKIPDNIEKLSALEVKFSEETGRNLVQRTDAVEGGLNQVVQRLSKLEGAESERNKLLEEGLKRFEPLVVRMI